MEPGISHKKIKRGNTLTFDYGFEGVNLSAAQVRIQVRKPNNGAIVFDSDSIGSITNPITKLYANNETKIKWVIPYSETGAVGKYEFEVMITVNTERNTWIEGTLEIKP